MKIFLLKNAEDCLAKTGRAPMSGTKFPQIVVKDEKFAVSFVIKPWDIEGMIAGLNHAIMKLSARKTLDKTIKDSEKNG